MRPLHTTQLTRLLAGCGLAAAIALSGAALPAHAATPGSTATITGGSLTGGTMTFGNFAGITLNGTQQTTTATWSTAPIIDATGSGAGWNLSLTLTQLAEYNTAGSAYVASGKTLPTSSIKVTSAPSVSLSDQTSSPANTITPVTTNTALDTGSPVKLLSAEIDGGMGSYSIGDATVTLTVPANAYAKTYKTDATVSLNTGP